MNQACGVTPCCLSLAVRGHHRRSVNPVHRVRWWPQVAVQDNVFALVISTSAKGSAVAERKNLKFSERGAAPKAIQELVGRSTGFRNRQLLSPLEVSAVQRTRARLGVVCSELAQLLSSRERRMKKSIAVFLAVIGGSSFVVACGSTSSDGNSAAAGGAGKSSSAGAGGTASAGTGGRASAGGGNNASAGTGGGLSTGGGGNASAGSGGSSTTGTAGNASSDGGGDAGLSFECGKLATCCAMLGGASEGSCQGVADANDDAACSTQLDTYGAACLVDASCNMSASGTCQELPIFPYYAMQSKSDCMQAGGTPVAACPTAGLIGCCTHPVAGGTCYYPNASAPTTQAACTQQGGTWSTTP